MTGGLSGDSMEISTGNWGDWKPYIYCPSGQFMTGFNPRYDRVGSSDFQSIAGMVVRCKAFALNSNVATTDVTVWNGDVGVWQGMRECPTNTLAVSAKGRVQPPGGWAVDDTGESVRCGCFFLSSHFFLFSFLFVFLCSSIGDFTLPITFAVAMNGAYFDGVAVCAFRAFYLFLFFFFVIFHRTFFVFLQPAQCAQRLVCSQCPVVRLIFQRAVKVAMQRVPRVILKPWRARHRRIAHVRNAPRARQEA
jgi:hypothetical protein